MNGTETETKMQIKHLPALPESPEWLITLDCDDERRLTDEEIVRLLENCAAVTWDEGAQRYALNGLDLGPVVTGTAKVTRSGDNLAIVLRLE